MLNFKVFFQAESPWRQLRILSFFPVSSEVLPNTYGIGSSVSIRRVRSRLQAPGRQAPWRVNGPVLGARGLLRTWNSPLTIFGDAPAHASSPGVSWKKEAGRAGSHVIFRYFLEEEAETMYSVRTLFGKEEPECVLKKRKTGTSREVYIPARPRISTHVLFS